METGKAQSRIAELEAEFNVLNQKRIQMIKELESLQQQMFVTAGKIEGIKESMTASLIAVP